jgi:hypothetical protein
VGVIEPGACLLGGKSNHVRDFLWREIYARFFILGGKSMQVFAFRREINARFVFLAGNQCKFCIFGGKSIHVLPFWAENLAQDLYFWREIDTSFTLFGGKSIQVLPFLAENLEQYLWLTYLTGNTFQNFYIFEYYSIIRQFIYKGVRFFTFNNSIL